METRNDRQVKLTLASIKYILDEDNEAHALKQIDLNKNIAHQQPEGQLKFLLKKIRIAKLKEVFTNKLGRSNVYKFPQKFNIQSQSIQDEKRYIKLKGIDINQQFLSLIYILDIIFCLVTFVTGSFRAFIDTFTTSGDNKLQVFTALMIIAIIVTSIKIIACIVGKTIEDGILLEYLTDIFINYISGIFWLVDVAYVAINIASLVADNDNTGLAVALFIVSLLKLFFLYDNLRVFQTTFINSFKKQQYFNLIKVLLFNLFFAHFVCSLLFAISLLDIQNNWRVSKQIAGSQWYIQYMWGYYWACTIIMTVGFGDYLPVTYREAFPVAFIELFSCIVLAFNISEIGSIIMAIRSSQTQYRRKIAIFKRMSKQDKIPNQLQRKIVAYLKQQTQIKQTFQYNQQSELLASVPQILKNQYIIESNQHLFPDLPFFKNLQKTTLVKLTENFNGKVYYPGQYLTRTDEGNDQILILKTGTVGLAYKKYGSQLNGTIVQIIEIQQKQALNSIGQYEKKVVPELLITDFLYRAKRINYDIIAQSYAFVFSIDHQRFVQVLKESQIDSSHYFSIKHKHTLISDEWEQIQCQHCSKLQKTSSGQIIQQHNYNGQKNSKDVMQLNQKKYHTKFTCPKLHYFPIQGVHILKYIRHNGRQQFRDQSYFRKRRRQSSKFQMRKTLYRKYEALRNISFNSKKILKQAGKQLNKKENISKYQNSRQRDHYRLQQMQMIQKIVKQSIQQALTGYRQDFWELQIDTLHNFANYFQFDNANNIDLLGLTKGKQKMLGKEKKRKSIYPAYNNYQIIDNQDNIDESNS